VNVEETAARRIKSIVQVTDFILKKRCEQLDMNSNNTSSFHIHYILLLVLSTMCCQSNSSSQIDKAVSDYLMCKKYINENFDSYKDIREMMKDSFLIHTERKQKYSMHPKNSFTIDSLLLFNQDKDRFVTTINVKKHYLKDSNIDVLIEAHGVRLGKDWYFNRSFDKSVTRSHFSPHSYVPLSFDLLSFLNRTTILNKYYKFDANHNLEIDYQKLDNRLSGRTLYGIKDYSDEEFIETTKERYSLMITNMMDSAEIKQVYSNVESVVAPKEPPMSDERKKRLDEFQNIFNKLGISVN
jgi:hypothetical protein